MMKTGISTKTNSFPPTYKNPNGCPIHGTFYVSHQYTNYAMVQKLWNQDMPKLSAYIKKEMLGYWGSSIRELQGTVPMGEKQCVGECVFSDSGNTT